MLTEGFYIFLSPLPSHLRRMDLSNVIIAGGGICGVATAYYLHRIAGIRSTIIDPMGIATSASGKAGGFLARDWAAGPETEELHRLGFRLHRELAAELGVKSYRNVVTMECDSNKPKSDTLEGPWLAQTTLMDSNTAQVTPLELVMKLFEASGAKWIQDPVDLTEELNAGTISEITLRSGKKIKCSHLVLCLGAWQWPRVFDIDLPMDSPVSASVIYEGHGSLPAQCISCEFDSETRCNLEIYPRPDGSVYVCGTALGGRMSNLDIPSPDQVVLFKPRPERIAAARIAIAKVLPKNLLGPVEKEQVCLRPCFPDVIPVLGPIGGSLISILNGGNCWGILWGPAMGLLMAQRLCGQPVEIPIDAFDPRRFTK